MKKFIIKALQNFVPQKIQNIYTSQYKKDIEVLKQQTVCFSQEGEDLILDTFFWDIKNGFFIDIGSYHPTRYSNTYFFYLKGWKGINIDANPGSMEAFKHMRPNDINIEQAIGTESKSLTYYMFNEAGLNGFSKILSEERDEETPYKIINKIDLPLKRLEDILDEYLPNNTTIHFMDIDVEGLDLDVLKSNNWDKYKPLMLLVETSLVSQDPLGITSAIHTFLVSKNYELVAKTYRTSFYKLICH